LPQDALIDIQLDPFATDKESIHLLNSLLIENRFASELKAKESFQLTEGVFVQVTNTLVNKNLICVWIQLSVHS
jgi:hypothetical protein